MPAGVSVIILGVWLIAQVTVGNALERLNVVNAVLGNGSAPSAKAATPPASGTATPPTVGGRNKALPPQTTNPGKGGGMF